MNSPSQSIDIRLYAGNILKVQIESNNPGLDYDSINYIKNNLLTYYYDREIPIKKEISNIIISFITIYGLNTWPEILNILSQNLDKKDYIENTAQILNLIIEDSRDVLESGFSSYLNEIIDKIIFALQSSKSNQINKIFLNILSTLFESCPNIMFEKMREFIPILKKLSYSQDQNILSKIEKIWYIVIHLDKVYVNQYFEDLFSFFLKNLSEKNYDQSFVAAQFFIYLISTEEDFLKDEKIKETLKQKLQELLPIVINNMVLSDKDINYLDNKFQNELVIRSITNSSNTSNVTNSGGGSEGTGSGTSNTNSNGTNSNSNSNSNNGSGNGSSGSNSGSNSGSSFTSENSSSNDYNPFSTLRKCCSRILDNISFIYPQETFNVIRPILENELQSNEDLIKERSILALGAVAQGCYQQVINHLSILIPFLLRELQHPDKYVRAITCWTLSRYIKYILIDNYSDNKDDLFKEFLTEILKKLLDKESIVREAAETTFQEIIFCKKSLVEPYLFDVLKVITSVFDKYTGSNLLSIYDTLLVIMDYYGDIFLNQSFVEEIIKCLVQKWYDLVKSNDVLTLPSFFEVVISLIRVSGNFLINYCDYFLTGCLKIIEINVNELRNTNYSVINIENELLSKSLDMISSLTQKFPSYIKTSPIKKNIIEFLFEMIKVKDLNIKNYVIILFGDMIKVNHELLSKEYNILFETLIPLLELIPNKGEKDTDKLSVCNNSIWTIGLLSLYFPQESTKYIDKIFVKLNDILCLQKVRLINIINR